MSTAQNIFLVYGVVILGYGFLLGVPLAAARMKSPAASHHLVMTHLSALMQGAIHLGLAYAISATDLTSWLATTAAILVVAGSALEATGGTVNWLQGTGDQFAEKSLGFRFNALTGPPAIIGISIIIVGVVRGL